MLLTLQEKRTKKIAIKKSQEQLRRLIHNCRPNIRYANYLQTKIEDDTYTDFDMHEIATSGEVGVRVLEYILTQNSLGRGLKHYGEKGMNATKRN